MKWEVKQKEKIYHGAIIGKKEFEKIQKKVKNNRNIGEKIYGYDFVDGKYQVNEKEATNLRNRIEKEVDTATKEEKQTNHEVKKWKHFGKMKIIKKRLQKELKKQRKWKN